MNLINTVKILVLLSVISFTLIFAEPANSKEIEKDYHTLPNLDYFLLADQDSGEIFLEKNVDDRISPSSMTKLMTAYVVFEEIRNGRIKLDNQCLIGRDAWKKRGSTMFLNHGDVVSVDSLIKGLIVVSGNDSAVALAQSVSGSIKAFAKKMTETAIRIGLKNSSFKNPHGLNQEGHYMTLRDLAILTTRISNDFPDFMHYFSTTEFTYGNITQKNRNPLIRYGYEGATGMKTGYTTDGGYGIVGTATRGNRNLIAITNNTLTSTQRKNAIFELLNYGFENFEKIKFFDKGDVVIKANVWLGKANTVDLITKEEISVTLPKFQLARDVTLEARYKDPIYSPIKKGEEVGSLVVKIGSDEIKTSPLFAKKDIPKASYFARMWRVFGYKTKKFLD